MGLAVQAAPVVAAVDQHSHNTPRNPIVDFVGKVWKDSFYQYLRESGPLCLSLGRLRKTVSMHICLSLALFARLWEGLEGQILCIFT